MTEKKADLAGPGIGNYDDLEAILPTGYASLLSPQVGGEPTGPRDQPIPDRCSGHQRGHDLRVLTSYARGPQST